MTWHNCTAETFITTFLTIQKISYLPLTNSEQQKKTVTKFQK